MGNCFALLAALLSCGQTSSVSGDLASHLWAIHAAGGGTLHAVDSSTTNFNLLAGLQYTLSEKRLRFGSAKGQVFQEFFFEHNDGRRNPSIKDGRPGGFDGVGYLFGLRFLLPAGAYQFYSGLGSGLFYTFRASQDLPARLNFAPYLDLGIIFPNGQHPLSLGMRFLHLSNGGTVSPNPGQNQIFLDLGVGF